MSKFKCPLCNEEIISDLCFLFDKKDKGYTNGRQIYKCNKCGLFGTKKLWEELTRTRKALDYAIDVIKTVAKMSDKMSIKYGETLVEQLDNIQTYCWEEGYVLTHKEDLERALKALEQKGE